MRRISAVAGAVAEQRQAAAAQVTSQVATTLGSPDLPGDLQQLGTLLKATTDEVPARVAALVAELQQADAKANPATLAGDDVAIAGASPAGCVEKRSQKSGGSRSSDGGISAG